MIFGPRDYALGRVWYIERISYETILWLVKRKPRFLCHMASKIHLNQFLPQPHLQHLSVSPVHPSWQVDNKNNIAYPPALHVGPTCQHGWLRLGFLKSHDHKIRHWLSIYTTLTIREHSLTSLNSSIRLYAEEI